MADELELLMREIVACRACPRLTEFRERVAREKKRAHESERYWGRPVPGFGSRRARVVLVGLAPGAHGANRTGRPFTGDASGTFLFRSLFEHGLASQPVSKHAGDGLRLRDAYITGAVRCVPPGNRPQRSEIDRCLGFLARELALLPRARVFLALGRVAYDGLVVVLPGVCPSWDGTAPRFRHGASVRLGDDHRWLLGSYHPSPLNTRTGRLSPAMLDDVVDRALELARDERDGPAAG
ncbi:MAG: uracil-DNA glycosylase [Acidobacteriota bacterium]|nr:uracil-DNA glycosylase [Acidobacteriota bacterium]